ncbi:MAG: hypothetical protein WKG00_40095 [Polyangiaceae bacterium]
MLQHPNIWQEKKQPNVQVASSQTPGVGAHIPPLAADATGIIPVADDATTADAGDEELTVLDAAEEFDPETLAELLLVLAEAPPWPPAPPTPLPELPLVAASSPSSESLPVAQLAASAPVPQAVASISTSSI